MTDLEHFGTHIRGNCIST